jgi:hypothetical protein
MDDNPEFSWKYCEYVNQLRNRAERKRLEVAEAETFTRMIHWCCPDSV